MSPDDEPTGGDTDGEVLTPEVLDGGPPPPEAVPAPGSADRRPLIAMLCGFGSLLFLIVVPIPVIMLSLAAAGIYLGRRLLREIGPGDVDRARDRKRAKAGLVAGLTTLALFVVLLIVLYFTYEPPDKVAGEPGSDKVTSQPDG